MTLSQMNLASLSCILLPNIECNESLNGAFTISEHESEKIYFDLCRLLKTILHNISFIVVNV